MSYKIQKSQLLTISDLRKLEKKEKQISRQRRITAVRMVMEGYTMVDVAAILGMHRPNYVKKLKEHALEGLLTRKQIPGKKPYLTTQQQEEFKQLILHITPAELQFGQESF